MNRRRMLGAALGMGAGLALQPSWPHIFVPRRSFAAPSSLAGPSGGAILIVLNGGARTQAAFNGTVGLGTNPFGQLTGLQVALSQVLQNTGLERPEINRHVNLVTTCQHHNRTGNHDTGRTVACTGFTPDEVKPGILTILNRQFFFRNLPCVHIGNDTPSTDIGTEISSTYVPIKISSPLNVQDILASVSAARVSPAEQARLEALRLPMQDRFLRSSKYLETGDIPFFQRRAAEVATQFEDDALDLRSASSLGVYQDGSPVANAGLRASFGVNANGGGSSMGARAMLALRLRQLGCAGIVLSSAENWDLHSNEDDGLPGRASQLGQALAALIDHGSRIPDPATPGKTLLDTTIITVLTDFNRGNWSTTSGFNGGRGSDHQSGDDRTSFQCIPIIGGGLPGGRVLGEVNGSGSAAGASPTFETRQVLATVLDVLGVPSENYFPASVRPLTRELGA